MNILNIILLIIGILNLIMGILWKRIGNQTMYKTQNTKVQVLIDGELKECALVFTNNGSDFHLEPVK